MRRLLCWIGWHGDLYADYAVYRCAYCDEVAWLCQVDLAPVGRFHSAPPEWGPEPLESGVWMGGRGCAVWLRRLVGIASRCVRMPSS